jgi:hypothetical protein
VLPLSAEIWDTAKVPELTPETETTEKTLILKLETEDAPVETLTFCNAESMADQTKTIRALKLMSDAQVNHGNQSTSKQARNSELPEKVGLKELAEDNGDH